jgi:alkanesulfonate monooxygenase SsuD/methylene tetrahydromethanopterin reductase-like flavin-dependent oxidoreductase (luciferase family)
MTRRLNVGFDWTMGMKERQASFDRVKVAEDAGVDTIFTSEAWGRDPFTFLTLLATRTTRVNLGTSIVNYYSRTPAALAQHFATLDELSGGRMIIGLGASSANVIEHFHGVPFNPTLARMRETVQIINMLMAEEPLNFKGKWFDLQRGFTLRFKPVRPHIPVYIASFRPKATQVVAEIADGWIPMMIPMEKMQSEVAKFLSQVKAAGRDPEAITIRSPFVTTVTKDKQKGRLAAKANLAFYIARMGDYYYQQLCDMGWADECNAVRLAWREGGSDAGYAAVTDELCEAMSTVGSPEECRDRLIQQEEAGINLHTISIKDAADLNEEARIIETLLR